MEEERDEDSHDEDDEQLEDYPRAPAVAGADLLGVQEDEHERREEGDYRGGHVELPALDPRDKRVGEEVGGEVREVDEDAVEVEVEAELVDEHQRRVVKDVDAEEDQARASADFPQRRKPEQVRVREGALLGFLRLFGVLPLETLEALLGEQLLFREGLSLAVEPGDELQALSDLFGLVALDEELRGFLEEVAAEGQAESSGQKAEADEDDFPLL